MNRSLFNRIGITLALGVVGGTLLSQIPIYKLCGPFGGDQCNIIENYCEGQVGSCKMCENPNFHDGCVGENGQCLIGLDGQGSCGAWKTASCTVDGRCNLFTATGNSCNRKICQ
jgi:hypothetical protein